MTAIETLTISQHTPPWVLAPTSWDLDVAPHARDCNSGAPMSRQRTLRLQASVLGTSGPVSLPPVRTVAIDFTGSNPIDAVRRRLDGLGLSSAEEAKAALLPPLPRCLCVVDEMIPATRFTTLDPQELVVQALILGLSTPWLYDPSRPVIWTKTSLTRRIVLYETEEFYA